MLSEADARERASSWAHDLGAGTTLELSPADGAWVAVAEPPARSWLAGRQLVAVVTAAGELQTWPGLPVDRVVAALRAEQLSPTGIDPRLTAVSGAGRRPGELLTAVQLAGWDAEVDRLHGSVPAARAHDTARTELALLGGRVLEAPDSDPVHVQPAEHAFDPGGCELAAELLDEPVAPVAVRADSWPTELYQGTSGRTIAVQVGEAYLLGPTLQAALCTLVAGGEWTTLEEPT